MIALELQHATRLAGVRLSKADALRYVAASLDTVGFRADCDISIRLVNRDESHALNLQYRGKDKPTNVLSFPSDLPDEVLAMLPTQPLGDLVICLPVVLAEAQAQSKAVGDHLAHLIVHGTFHLLGFDHETSDDDAAHMEGLEIGTMARLRFCNPYA